MKIDLVFFIKRLPDKFKQAIRVMRRMKFFVARRKFQVNRNINNKSFDCKFNLGSTKA